MRNLINPLLLVFVALGLIAAPASAEVRVRVERLQTTDPGWKPWKFQTLPGPSKSDAATGATVTFVGNVAQPDSTPADLTDGRMPSAGNRPTGFAFFTNANSAPGKMLMDLGHAINLAQINSYSWHEHPAGQGARGPQVFTLYGSATEKPDPHHPESADWTKIAEVDTRPNKTGEKWGGQFAVSIGEPGQSIGKFRWLLWSCRPTLSPKESPVFTHTFFCELDVHTPQTLARAGDAELIEPKVREIVVVFKTHFDIGYHDFPANIVKRYRTSFTDGALALIDRSRQLPTDQQFTWTVPGWPMEQMAGASQTAVRREQSLKALKEGRLALHALPFTLETEALDLEDLVRGMTFSAKLARSVGIKAPRAAKMTDVPCHSWVVPTLLNHCGVKFLHIGCNGASHVVAVPPLFWWEGPDGSRVLTEYSGDYGTSLFPPENWPYRTWLAMIMTGDNVGPPSPGEVDKIRRSVAQQMPGVKLKFGKMEDFYDAIAAETDAKIPVVRADMPDTWIHGFESMPVETKTAWNVRPLETAAGILDTQLRGNGLTPPPLGAAMAEAYENSLLYSEHTFGLFGSAPGGFWYGDAWKKQREAGRYKRFEAIFDAKRAYIHNTARIVHEAVGARMDLLARSVQADGPRIIVFNPLPWRRSGLVEVQGAQFFAADVPPCGYKTFPTVAAQQSGRPEPAAPRQSAGMIENEYFRLTVDPVRGGIASLVDLKTGRQLIDGSDKGGQFLHERFSHDNVQAFCKAYIKCPANWAINDFGKPGMPGAEKSPYAKIALGNWKLGCRQDSFSKSITLECPDAAPLAKSVTLKYTLYAGQPYLDLQWSIVEKTPDAIPEGGWLCLPLAIQRPSFKLARVGAIVDPAKDIIAGGNRQLLCLNSGMTVTDPNGQGVGLCPIDSPLVSLGEPGLWKYSDTYVPGKSNIFVNLYNNMWNTNFPLWQEGSWSSRMRLWVVRSDSVEQSIIRPSWEARTPLLVAQADGPGGKLPAEQAGLELSRGGVLVTNFGPDPYSDRTLLRVWEQAGVSGKLVIRLPKGLKATKALPVDLRGEPLGAACPIQDGSFTVDLPAYAPASYVLLSDKA